MNMATTNVNVNEFIFGRTKAEKKLEILDSLSDAEIRKATDATMLRIYKECRGDRDRFYINSERRVGNNWCSTIEFIYEYQGHACVCLDVQNSSTDSSTCESYNKFNRDNSYRGYCDNLGKSFTYDYDDIARVIRCILKEYVYYKYIEKAERERAERVQKVMHYKILNPVLNQFYDEWRCKYQGGYPGAPHDRLDRYYRAKKAVESYVNEHIDELDGKGAEELQSIYRKIFRETN